MSGDGNSVNSRIRTFVVQNFPAARKRAMDDDVPLLASGIVDSLGVLDLVAFIEQSFMIQVSDDELTPDNFANIGTMSSFVEKKRSEVRVPE